jgi:hypothetical protein
LISWLTPVRQILFTEWKSVLLIVKADTVVAWHRKSLRLFLQVEDPP